MAVPDLTYAGSPYKWRRGASVGTISPTNAGGAATSRTITSGTVPAGMTLENNCDITGTPTTYRAAEDITFTPTNGDGDGPPVTISAAVVNALLDGLAAFYACDDPDVLADAVGDHPASDTGGITTIAGKIAQAASLNGSTQYMTVAHDSTLQPTDKFSVSFWLKRDGTSPGNIIQKWTTGDNQTFVIRVNGLDVGDVICYVEGADGYGYTASGKVSSSEFTNGLVVYDGTQTGNADRLKIYINGSQESLTFDASTVPATLTNGAADIQMGGPSFFVDGALDLVGYYPDTALDAIDALNIYNGGAGLAHSSYDSTLPPVAPDLTYYNAPFAFGAGVAIRSIVPGNAGGTATACTVDAGGDQLPTGLTLAPNGTISGTPTETGTFDILINNSNQGVAGAQASLTIEVRAGAMLGGISYAPNVRYRASDLVLAEDADVSTWADVHGGTALTGVVGNEPKYRASVLGGHPAVYFDGVGGNGRMTRAIDWTNHRDGVTIFAVWRNVKWSSNGTAGTPTNQSYSCLVSVNTAANLIFGKTGASGGPWHVLGGKESGSIYDADFMSATAIGYSKRDSRYRVKFGLVDQSLSATGYMDIADTQLDVGGQTNAFGSPFHGYLLDLVIYTAPLSNADVDAVKAALEELYELDVAPLVVLDGDSITNTEVRPSWPSYAFQMMDGENALAGKLGPIVNLSVGGQILSQIAARVPTAAGYIDPAREASVYSAAPGSNDFAQSADPITLAPTLAAAYKTMLQDARTAGFDKIVACTIIARTGNITSTPAEFETAKELYNDEVRSWTGDGTYDGLADFAADVSMGDPASCADTDLFLDTVHPTDVGATRLAVIFAATMDALFLEPAPSLPATQSVTARPDGSVAATIVNSGGGSVTYSLVATPGSVPGGISVSGTTDAVLSGTVT